MESHVRVFEPRMQHGHSASWHGYPRINRITQNHYTNANTDASFPPCQYSGHDPQGYQLYPITPASPPKVRLLLTLPNDEAEPLMLVSRRDPTRDSTDHREYAFFDDLARQLYGHFRVDWLRSVRYLCSIVYKQKPFLQLELQVTQDFVHQETGLPVDPHTRIYTSSVVVLREEGGQCADGGDEEETDWTGPTRDGDEDDYGYDSGFGTNSSGTPSLQNEKVGVSCENSLNLLEEDFEDIEHEYADYEEEDLMSQHIEDRFGKVLGDVFDMHLEDVRDYLRRYVLLRRSDIVKREQVIRGIERILNEAGHPCRLFIFGSGKNRLGLRGNSDVDLYVQYHHVGVFCKNFATIKKKLTEMAECLQENTEELFEGRDVHMEVICHKHMRVPIVRLTTNGSYEIDEEEKAVRAKIDFQVDFNMSNALGVVNTRLVRYLCDLEPRFHVLNVLLRLWAKQNGLIKACLLSSYALTNLILFYCQKCHPPVLPPIDHFVQLSSRPKSINHWRCDFETDFRLVQFHTQNRQSVFELLAGFFRYYLKFPFRTRKISTCYGKTIPYARYRTSDDSGRTFIWIIDPFEKDHNLSARVKHRELEFIVKSIQEAMNKYHKFFDAFEQQDNNYY